MNNRRLSYSTSAGRIFLRLESRGFSLIELMVAMTLSLILLAVVSLFYLTSVRAQNSAIAYSELNQNARIALTLITKDLSSAGYSNGVPFASVSADALSITGNNCRGLAAPDNVNVSFMAGQGPGANSDILGCVNNAGTGNYNSSDGAPSDWLLIKGAIGPEVDSADLQDDTSYLISNSTEGAIFIGKSPPPMPNGVIRPYLYNLIYRSADNDLIVLELDGNRLTPRVLASDVMQVRVRLGMANQPASSDIEQWIDAPATTENINYWRRVRAVEVNVLARGRQTTNINDTKEYDVGGITVKGKSSHSPAELMTQTVFLYNNRYREVL